MKYSILSIIGSALIFSSCSSSPTTVSGNSVKNVKLSSTARFDYVSNGTITYYPMLATGLPDTTNPLGSCTTDSTGTCTVTLAGGSLTGVTAIVAELSSGTYNEESTGQSVSITTPIYSILPIDSSTQTDPNATITIAITPYSNIAAQDTIQKASDNMLSAGIAAGQIPPEFAGLDPLTSTNADFQAAFNKYAENNGMDPDLIDKANAFALSAIADLSKQLGLANIVTTAPIGSSEASAAYASLLSSLSQAAANNNTNSINMGEALSAVFSRDGSLPTSMEPISITGPDGKTITLTPPVINSDGSITMTGPDGSPVTLPEPGSSGMPPMPTPPSTPST